MGNNDEHIDIESLLFEDRELDPPEELVCCPPSRRSCTMGVYVCTVFTLLFGGCIFILVWLITKE